MKVYPSTLEVLVPIHFKAVITSPTTIMTAKTRRKNLKRSALVASLLSLTFLPPPAPTAFNRDSKRLGESLPHGDISLGNSFPGCGFFEFLDITSYKPIDARPSRLFGTKLPNNSSHCR